jgi:hypothetical protein
MKSIKILFIAALLQVACKKEIETVTVPDIGTMMGLGLSKNQGMEGIKAYLEPTIIYSSVNLPSNAAFASSTNFFKKLPDDFDNNIESFTLNKGFMATFAENEDGTGESICYVAAISNITKNLPERLKKKVSFVRFLPVVNTQKKGTGNTNITVVNALGTSWFYNWGLNLSSSPTQNYVPMTWGKNASSLTQANTFIGKTGIDHFLSFNEPDNPRQSNIASIDTAVNRYKSILYSGLRMGSPATEQDNALATRWLNQFMTAADEKKLRVDFLALHWYDWGNQTAKAATDSLTAVGVLNRFKNYVNRIRTLYPDKQLWFTEYNANPARSVEVHLHFMKMSSEWLNTQNYVERYAYFFPSTMLPSTPDFKLTPIGQAWANLPSTPAFAENIIPK